MSNDEQYKAFQRLLDDERLKSGRPTRATLAFLNGAITQIAMTTPRSALAKRLTLRDPVKLIKEDEHDLMMLCEMAQMLFLDFTRALEELQKEPK